MIDAKKWALNAEIAEAIEPAADLPVYIPGTHGFSPKRCWWKFAYGTWQPRDFAGDMNAAIEMGERLNEIGLRDAYTEAIFHMPGVIAFSYLQASAEVRAQAAAEVLRERGEK